MAKAYFELERVDPELLRRMAGTLKALGYSESGVRERLGVKDLASLELDSYPYYTHHRLRRRSPLDLAILLFLLQGTVTEEELATVLDRPSRRLLRGLGILAGDSSSRSYRARVSLYPVEDRLFFTDHRFTHNSWLRARAPREPVMFVGSDTYMLARTTLRQQARAVLDLGTGCGIQAILAAPRAERVVGTDINPRAINFARLNAILNDVWNSVFVEGDLFAPAGNERFDLIIAHPPFVPAPVYEVAYRDGGPSGADVLRRVIASLPDYLASDGVAQVVTHVAEREGEPYLERIRRWLGGANMHIHSVRLGEEDVVDYAERQVRRDFGEQYPRYAERLVDWVTNLRAQRFRRVLTLVLTFQWNDEAPHPPWTQEDEAKPPLGDISGEIARLLQARKRVRKLPSLQALDRMRVSVPDDVLLVERRRPAGEGFAVKDFRVMFRRATLSPELDIKPLVRDLLERIDNRSTIPQVIARLASDTRQQPADIDERCRRAFLVMLERGLVTMDEVPASGDPGPDLVRPAHEGKSSLDPDAERASQDDDSPISPTRVDLRPGTDSLDPDLPGARSSHDGLAESLDPDGPAGPGHTLRS